MKYFLNREKRKYTNKYIKKLIIENNIVITKPKEILKEQEKYYKTFITANYLMTRMVWTNAFFQENSIPKLDEIDKAWCGSDITIHELSKALSELKKITNLPD